MTSVLTVVSALPRRLRAVRLRLARLLAAAFRFFAMA
jgi:hypothetical protein